MPTISNTFTFTASAGSWTGYSEDHTSTSWDSDGNPGGSLQAGYSSATTQQETAYWEWSGTWAELFSGFGLPDSALVKKVRISVDTRCNQYVNMFDVAFSASTGTPGNAVRFYDTAFNELWAGRSVTGSEGSWTGSGLTDWHDVASSAQETTSTIKFQLWGAFHGAVNGGASLLWDNFKVEIEYAHRLVAVQGSYTLTGYPLDILTTLLAAQGSYTLTGNAVGLIVDRKLSLTQGAYVLTGYESNRGYTLALASGDYTVTGYATPLLVDRTIPIDAGGYALTGQDVGFLRGLVLDAVSGSYSLTGQATGLLVDRIIALAQGSYVVTGYATGLGVDRALPLDQGSYVLSGQNVDLLADRRLVADQGSYTLTGYATAFPLTRHLSLDQGSYVLTGFDTPTWATIDADARYLIYDLWLAYDDPADYDTASETKPFKLPLRIGYMYGFGEYGGALPGFASTPVNDREMVILDADDRVVIDTAEIESGHETIYYRRAWTDDLDIVGWEKKHAVLFVVVRTNNQDEHTYSAVLRP
jgi:hypothetical protein